MSDRKTTLLAVPDDTGRVASRARQLKLQMESASSSHEGAQLWERGARLTDGIALIKVGGFTETERKERVARADDALHAARAALVEGVVPGGGVALLRCGGVVDALPLFGDEKTGARIVRHALASPLRALCRNAGIDNAVIADAVSADTGTFGYNLATSEYADLMEAGVVDATKVTRLALQNAASIAGLLLTMRCIIVEGGSLTARPERLSRFARERASTRIDCLTSSTCGSAPRA